MTYTPEQISQIVLRFLRKLEPDVSKLSYHEKVKLTRDPNTSQETLAVLATDKSAGVRRCVAQHPNYKKQTLELNTKQYDALKKLIESSQDESLKGIM